MRVSKEFASRYLKHVDIEDELVVEISHVIRETVGKDREQRWVVYFADVQKGLILNPTNARACAEVLGDDSDKWGGAIVTLYVEETAFGPGVRIRPSTVRNTIENDETDETDKSGPFTEANPPFNMGNGDFR